MNLEALYLDIETKVTGESKKHKEKDLKPVTGKVITIQTMRGSSNKVYVQRPTTKAIAQLQEQVKTHVVVGHNLAFDVGFLKYQYQVEPEHYFDTMIAESLIRGGLGVSKYASLSLKSLTMQYLGFDLIKGSVTKSFTEKPLTLEQKNYAAMDVAVLPEIHRRQQEILKEQGLEQVFETEMRCLPATIWLELSGMPLDLNALKEQRIDNDAKREAACLAVLEILKQNGFKGIDNQTNLDGLPVINVGSTEQLQKALKSFGLRVNRTDEDTLVGLEHPIGAAILKYKKYLTRENIFFKKYQNILYTATGRVYAKFNQYGTETGRFSSSLPNFQQIPREKEIRRLFRTSNGSKIITGDYSQIELRIVAELSQEPKFIEAYKTGGDIHRQTASFILKKPINEISDAERQQAKAINFGFAYGQGVNGFRRTAKSDYGLDISFEDAEELQKKFFENYSVLNKYLEDVATKASVEKKIINRAGRHVAMGEQAHEASDENKGRNYPIQSLSADITKIAMGEFYVKLKPYHAKLINAVHDELVFETEAEKAEAVKDIVIAEMVKAGERFIKTIPVTVDVKISDRWSK